MKNSQMAEKIGELESEIHELQMKLNRVMDFLGMNGAEYVIKDPKNPESSDASSPPTYTITIGVEKLEDKIMSIIRKAIRENRL